MSVPLFFTKIIQVGGLDILIKAMKSENEKEQIGAVKTVYFLSFKPTKAQVCKLYTFYI